MVGTAGELQINGFSAAPAPTRVFRKFRIRSVNTQKDNGGVKSVEKKEESAAVEEQEASTKDMQLDSNTQLILSEKRKALFEPLEPSTNILKRPSAETLLPPPDFESASYPKGWLIGKKRKLVNVDVVESMRRIAIQEMNRKDREIDGLNEQLEEDARVLEHLQLQLLEERSKRSEAERQNAMLQSQITVLMEMLQEDEAVEDEGNDHGL